MKYQEVYSISRDEAESAFASGDIEKICDAMLSIAFYDNDWKWVQDKCLFFLSSDNERMSSLAATCLGHVARIHRRLDKQKVISALKLKKTLADISGFIDDALDEINFFIKD